MIGLDACGQRACGVLLGLVADNDDLLDVLGSELARDFGRGTVSPTLTETPIWLIDSAIFIGLVLFMMQLLASAFLTVKEGVPEDVEAE